MRAIVPGLLAAGLLLGSAVGASAGHGGQFDALDVFSFGQLRHGDNHPHFFGAGFFAPTGIPFIAPPATQPTEALDPIVIVAPTYAPVARSARPVSSGPRIIVIGAGPAAGKLLTLIYGIPPLTR